MKTWRGRSAFTDWVMFYNKIRPHVDRILHKGGVLHVPFATTEQSASKFGHSITANPPYKSELDLLSKIRYEVMGPICEEVCVVFPMLHLDTRGTCYHIRFVHILFWTKTLSIEARQAGSSKLSMPHLFVYVIASFADFAQFYVSLKGWSRIMEINLLSFILSS